MMDDATGTAPSERDRDGPWGEGGPDCEILSREVCRSSPLEVIRSNLNSYFYPARVETRMRGADLSGSLLSAVRLPNVTIGFLRFGAEAMVDPGALHAYHVNVPVAGRVASVCGPRETVATVGRAAVFTPREHTRLPSWSDDAAQICIKIAKPAVDAELEAMLGQPVAGDIRFDLAFDLTTPPARSWLAVLRLLLEEIDRPGSLLDRSADHRDHMEKLLISGLLHAQPHDHLDALTGDQPAARPRTVKRVVDLIEARPEANYSLGDLAHHAGVGSRRLQLAFQEVFHTTPIGYLRKIKLDRARADLVSGEEDVAAVAYRWGFTHPGRFAAAYRAAFGELPSRTVWSARRGE